MKISVVVPVYNVEKYLERCVKSILDQTHKELEILLVDDGSTDASGSLCDELGRADERIRVIHKANGGLSDARNAGLAVAEGEFVCFIDSDDWIEPETLQKAVEAMEDADLVIWGYRKDFVDEREEVLSYQEQKVDALLTKGTGYQTLLLPGVLQESGYAWNKLYRLDHLRRGGHVFEKGLSLVEDAVFNYPLFLELERIRLIDVIGSHYVQRDRTTLGTAFYPNRMELKLRTAKLFKELLCGFGAPEDVAREEYEQYVASAFRTAVRSIAWLKVSYGKKRQELLAFLGREQVNDVVKNCHARRGIDRLILLLARLRFVDVMIAIEGRKR